VGALVDAWGFGAARDAPDAAAIRAAPRPAYEKLELDPAAGRARKHALLQVDLCGIAKGYAVDRMAQVLQQHGVAHALAALDGELRALGSQADGTPWAVALERPDTGRRAAHGVLELADLAVATSGDYRHFVQVGEARLAHSMDGRSGGRYTTAWPASPCWRPPAWTPTPGPPRCWWPARAKAWRWRSAMAWKCCGCCAGATP
jgi:thiamine biosynthesis lipoprotein